MRSRSATTIFHRIQHEDQCQVCCGSGSSGRQRFFIAGEKQQISTLRHVTAGRPISISADWADVVAQRKWAEACQLLKQRDHFSLESCDDWLCHGGNVDFAQNRSSFGTYQALDEYVLSANGNVRLRVLGIRTMRIGLK